MVTLIGFLLFTTSFLSIVNVESTFPEANKNLENSLKEKPLQLTLSLGEKEAEIWSPFDRIQPKKIPNTEPGQPDLKAIHESLIEIKKGFPQESKLVLIPNAASNYDTLISVMDSARMLDAGDPPIFAKNAQTGTDEAVKNLFPEIIFGNLLGDS
jgi:biopolymer transport protein ExbD